MASKTLLLAINLCLIANIAASYNTTSTEYDVNSFEASKERYNRQKVKTVLMVLKKPGFPLQYNSITNRMQQDVIPSADEAEEIKEKLRKMHEGVGIFPKGIPSSMLDEKVMAEAIATRNYLIDIPTLEEFLKTCTVLRDMINTGIYAYSLITALIARPDTKSVPLPSIEYMFPHWFVPASTINQARRKVMAAPNEEVPIIVEHTFEKSDYDNLEDQLAYFREDICFNAHHYYWHLLYPPSYSPDGRMLLDRKGELFIFTHQQYLARYDAERLSCNLFTVEPFDNFSIPLKEGYDPKLLNSISGSLWRARKPNTYIVDVINKVSIANLKYWIENIKAVIDSGQIWLNSANDVVDIPQSEGVSIIADLIEPNRLSKYYSSQLYGNYHGQGHLALGRCDNPNDTNPNAETGVVYDLALAPRDPVFHRWHKHLDQIASRYQARLKPYTKDKLSSPGITITNISVNGKISLKTNVLTTFWAKRPISIQNGIFVGGNNPITINTEHLQHEDFNYTINVLNTETTSVKCTVRIFIAPKFDEKGAEIPFEKLRKIFIVMDTFLSTVEPGKQVITRQSKDSSVTIPPGLSFELLESTATSEAKRYCGCGWPDHMLLPKGKKEGMAFIYFVMLTKGDYNETLNDPTNCITAPTLCGLVNQKYPDEKSMGYPFDRRANDTVTKIGDFVTSPNMKISEIIIMHDNSLHA